MGETVNLDAYFHRISYAGSRRPSLATLRAIHRLHPEAIAFENFDPLLGLVPGLDIASLQRKLVHDGRGGWCFEQNLLLSAALTALGFRVRQLGARVLWGGPADRVAARSHMLLRIDLDEGPYIADVGFGAMTLTGPLRLVPGVEQTTPHEPFRLIRAGDDLRLEARLGETWTALYRFDQQAQFLPDYEVSNYYLSKAPSSHFIHGLMVARHDPDRRHTLRNNQIAVHHRDGATERRRLTDAAALRDALEDTFRLHLPDTPALGPLLEHFARMED